MIGLLLDPAQMKDFYVFLAVKRHLKESSIHTTRIKVKYFYKWLNKDKLTPESVKNFILHLREKGSSNATINGYLRIFKLFEYFYEDTGQHLELLKGIEYFPKVKHTPTILSPEEIKLIIKAPVEMKRRGLSKERHQYINDLMKYTIWFLAVTGCRIDEMASLRRENLFIGNPSYVEFKNTKTDLDRRVPIPQALADELTIYVKDKKPKDLIFLSAFNHKILEQTWNPLLRQKVDNAGLKQKHVYAHCFRNSFIMEHLEKGTDLFVIMTLVGHRDPKTTYGYTAYQYKRIFEQAMNHALFMDNWTPEDKLSKIREEIERILCKYAILKDIHFCCKDEKSSDKYMLEVEIKK